MGSLAEDIEKATEAKRKARGHLIARMAGNIAAGLAQEAVACQDEPWLVGKEADPDSESLPARREKARQLIAEAAVDIAIKILDEVDKRNK